jgi:hypothetical protein
MTDEEKQQTEAYIKLQDNVQKLVISAVYDELVANPYGMLANHIRMILQSTINDEMKQYRITRTGQTAQY